MRTKSVLAAIAYYLVFGLLLVLVVAGSIAVFITVEVIRDASYDNATEIMNTFVMFVMSVAYAVPVLVFYAFFKLRKKNVKEEWRFNGFTKQLGLYAAGAAFFLQFAWLFLINTGSSSPLLRDTVPPVQLIAALLNGLLVAPFCHQILMNGIIYTRAEKENAPLTACITTVALSMVVAIAANIVTALVPVPNPVSIGSRILSLVYSFLSELFIVYLFSKSRSLWLCIVASMASCIPGVCMQLFNYSSDGIRYTFCVIFALCGAALLYLCIRQLRKSRIH